MLYLTKYQVVREQSHILEAKDQVATSDNTHGRMMEGATKA